MSKINIDLLRNVPLFKALNDEGLNTILNAPENSVEEYEKGQTILRQFEIGDCMYVVLEGLLEVSVQGGAQVSSMIITKLGVGDFFGEQALLPWGSGARNATVKARLFSRVFRIDKKYVLLCIKTDGEEIAVSKDKNYDISIETETYEQEETPEFNPTAIAKLVKNIRLFKYLSQQELASIGDWSEVINLNNREFAIKKFQKATHMYVILEGNVKVLTLGEGGEAILLAKLKTGDFFGEQALMPESKGKHNAFVRAINEVTLLKIPIRYFRLILMRDDDILEELKKTHKHNLVKEQFLIHKKKPSSEPKA